MREPPICWLRMNTAITSTNQPNALRSRSGWILPTTFYLAFIPRDENLPPAIICSESTHDQTQASWIETVVYWDYPGENAPGAVEESLVETVAAWLNKLQLSRSRVATEMGTHFRMDLSVEMFDRIRAALPDVTWTDCGRVIWPVRSIKSEEEIRRLRESIRITCSGVRAGFEAVRDGASERDIANAMSSTMHALGCGDIRFLSLFCAPDRTHWWDSFPRRDVIIHPGSLLQFDGGCTYEGYYTDIIRFACLGEPTDDQRRFHDVARASQRAAIDAIAPGVPYSLVYERAVHVLREAGCGGMVDWLKDTGMTSIGHNVGLDIHERPGVSAESDAAFHPNQVVAIEPFVSHHGIHPIWEAEYWYVAEDMVLVTDSGHEVLSPDSLLSSDIWVA